MNLNLTHPGPASPMPLAFRDLALAKRALARAGEPNIRAREHRLVISVTNSETSGDSDSDFARILSDVLARLANCPATEIKGELETAFRRVCEYLEIERAGMWCRSPENAESFTLAHFYLGSPTDSTAVCSALGAQPGADFKTRFPWLYSQVQLGKTVTFWTHAELPPEADSDTAALLNAG